MARDSRLSALQGIRPGFQGIKQVSTRYPDPSQAATTAKFLGAPHLLAIQPGDCNGPRDQSRLGSCTANMAERWLRDLEPVIGDLKSSKVTTRKVGLPAAP